MSTRIPHLGHLALLLFLAVLAFVGCEAVALALFHPHDLMRGALDQRLQLLVNAALYVVTLLLAIPIFTLLWKRPFGTGLQWNWPAVKPRLLGFGLALGFVAQATTALLPKPKDMPIEHLFRERSLIWILVIFGTVAAPLFEEILFRGFLLPGIAIAVDFVRLPKSYEAHEQWRAGNRFSRSALWTAALITSLLFAAIHAPQLGFSWPAVTLLVGVSLVLCWVRLHFRSVAASTVVHAIYNFSVFLTAYVASHGFRDLGKL